MYVLTEYAFHILLGLLVGGGSFVMIASFLIIMEGLDAAMRGSRAK